MRLSLIDNWKAALDIGRVACSHNLMELDLSKAKLKAHGVAQPGVALMQNYDL